MKAKRKKALAKAMMTRDATAFRDSHGLMLAIGSEAASPGTSYLDPRVDRLYPVVSLHGPISQGLHGSPCVESNGKPEATPSRSTSSQRALHGEEAAGQEFQASSPVLDASDAC